MGHSQADLRDVVIRNPINAFVDPVTRIICDPKLHYSEFHRVVQKEQQYAWKRMTEKALISQSVIDGLLKDHTTERRRLIVSLMKKYGFLVRVDNNDIDEYLVPPLLLVRPPHEMDRRAENVVKSVFFYAFSTNGVLNGKPAATLQDYSELGFLPRGLFERLITKAVSWSQSTLDRFRLLEDVVMYKDEVALYFGSFRFIVRSHERFNLIEVLVDHDHPVCIHDRLADQLIALIEESFSGLNYYTLLPFPKVSLQLDDSKVALFKLELVRETFQNKEGIRYSAIKSPLTYEMLNSQYGAWLMNKQALDSYEVFESYRWNDVDTKLASRTFDIFSRYSYTPKNLPIHVFLDTSRLKDGNDFQISFFKALTQSTVVVAWVTTRALERLIHHNAETVDNMLIEWITALISCKSKCDPNCNVRVKHILPVFCGSVVASTNEIKNIFTENTMNRLSNEVPRATMNKVIALFRDRSIAVPDDCEIFGWTVKEIVSSISAYQGVKAWEVQERDVQGRLCVEKEVVRRVVQILNEDAAAAAAAATAAAATVLVNHSDDDGGGAALGGNRKNTGTGVDGIRKRDFASLSAKDLQTLLVNTRKAYTNIANYFFENDVDGAIAAEYKLSNLLTEVPGCNEAVAQTLIKEVAKWVVDGV